MSFAITAALLLQAAPAPGPDTGSGAPLAPPSCDSEGHAGFDFWVGEWEVTSRGSERVIANSRIERRHRGCAVVERWMPLAGEGGTSLNHFDPATQRWHQKWVGQAPGAVDFVGGRAGEAMVLQGYWGDIGGPGRDGLIRMTYTPGEDRSVRQHGEVSFDHGLTWADSFDFIYRPKTKDSE